LAGLGRAVHRQTNCVDQFIGVRSVPRLSNPESSISAVLAPQAPPVDLGTAAAAQAALRSFWRLAEAWRLTVPEQATLLGVGRTTLYQWKQGKVGPLDRHVLERLSYLFGIHAALQVLLPVPERANEWVRRPNEAPFLGGQPALARMLGGQVADLYVVRQYLDAQRGGKA
jgi:hypothetical protein